MSVSLNAVLPSARVAGDLDELQRLRRRVAELDQLLGASDAALIPLKLYPQGRALLGLLMARASVSIAQFCTVLYAGRPDCDWPLNPDKVVHVAMHRLRRRLAPLGIVIETQLEIDRGAARYALSPDAKCKLRALRVPSAGRSLS